MRKTIFSRWIKIENNDIILFLKGPMEKLKIP